MANGHNRTGTPTDAGESETRTETEERVTETRTEPAAERRTDPAAETRTEPAPTARPNGFLARATSATLRLIVGLAGFILVLYALGQVVGVDILESFAGAVSTEPGRWLVIAVFGLLLIFLAARTSMTRV